MQLQQPAQRRALGRVPQAGHTADRAGESEQRAGDPGTRRHPDVFDPGQDLGDVVVGQEQVRGPSGDHDGADGAVLAQPPGDRVELVDHPAVHEVVRRVVHPHDQDAA
jgi:hypothetical protein